MTKAWFVMQDFRGFQTIVKDLIYEIPDSRNMYEALVIKTTFCFLED